jgi:hypothetical protein
MENRKELGFNWKKTLNRKVPMYLRLQIYQTALKILNELQAGKKPAKRYGLGDGPGLCLLLPCILWNLDNYLDDAPDGNWWDYHQTSIAFPELTEKFIVQINYLEREGRVLLRIEFLEKTIRELKEKLSNRLKP